MVQDGVLKQGEHVLPQAKRVMSLLTGRSGELSRRVQLTRQRAHAELQTCTLPDDHEWWRCDRGGTL